MNVNIKFKFIGWCNEDNHDKIWGYFVKPRVSTDIDYFSPPCYAFYGKRGKKLTFKKYTVWDAENLVDQKEYKKHYHRVDEAELMRIWPTFYEELESDLCFAILADKIK